MSKCCSVCGEEIDTVNNGYLKVLDNYLQVKYFESDEDNCFCSTACLAKYMSAEYIYEGNEEKEGVL